MKKIKKIYRVWIEPGCLSCGACEFIAPEIFHVHDVSHVKKDADVKKYTEEIKKAAKECPAEVIRYEEEEEK